MDLKRIVEESDTPLGRAFDIVILSLIILSLFTFAISTVPGLSPTVVETLRIIRLVTIAVFTVEYILRILVADSKPGYIFSGFGIIDLLAILPFYLSFVVDLSSLRALRLLRIFRILTVVRYSNALDRYRAAFGHIREEIILFMFSTFFLLYLSAVGIYYFEHAAQPEVFKSVFHSLWWAITTLTTVGYGDMYPVTVGGRVFTFIILMIGLSIVAVPAGLLASALQRVTREENQDAE